MFVLNLNGSLCIYTPAENYISFKDLYHQSCLYAVM